MWVSIKTHYQWASNFVLTLEVAGLFTNEQGLRRSKSLINFPKKINWNDKLDIPKKDFPTELKPFSFVRKK